MDEAFDISMSGIPGPVFIECPIDILYEEKLVREWYGRRSKSEFTSFKQKMVNWYLKRHVDKLFACSINKVKVKENENIIPFEINQEYIQKVASQINNAKKPVLIFGGQIAKRIELVEELSRGLKNFGVPIFLASMSRGLLGRGHHSYFRHGRSKALKEADLVIIVGMPCDFRLNYGGAINKKAFHIAINRSEDDLTKNKKPDLAIQSDPATFMVELTKTFSFEKEKWNEWYDLLNKWESEGKEEIDHFANIDTKYLNPLALLKELNNHIQENAIIIGDGGDFVATTSYIIKPPKPLSWLDPGPYGTLGAGAGFALAAKLVNPDSDVWLFWGDGAAGYSIAEFDTFMRHKLPIIAIVGNDAGWTQIERDQVEYLNDDVGTTLKYTDYHLVAEGYGGEGLILKNRTNISRVVKQAKLLVKDGAPVLINALMGKTDFRKGSISM